MKRTLPAPNVRVTNSGRRPNSLGRVLVDGQDIAAGLGPEHGGVPLKAGEPLPDLGIIVLGIGQLREQASAPEFGELEMIGGARAPTSGLRGVENHGTKVSQLGVQKRKFTPLRTPA